MKIEDYNKYYIQGSDHYLVPKDVFKELFNEMVNWKEEAYDVTHKIKYNERSRRRMQKSLMEKINLLEDNWNKLKEWLEEYIETNEKWYSSELSNHDKEYYKKDYIDSKLWLMKFQNQIQELEQGSDSNE